MVNWIGPPEMGQEAAEMFDAMAKILAGRHPFIQGAVLADLLALWLAGQVTETREATDKMRENILAEHIKAVQLLIPENEKLIRRNIERAWDETPKH